MASGKSKNHLSINEHAFLFEACEQGDLKTLKEYLDPLVSSEITSIRDEQKATLVHYASRYGHLHILEYFIEKKHLDINELCTEHKATCIHDAAVCDQVEALDYLFNCHQLDNQNKQILSQKLRWTIRDEQGHSPLHLAAAYGSIRTLHYLLEQESVDPHIRSYNGFQPIHFAASSGYVDCVKLLLNAAPDTVNEQTNTLLTPLYLACQHGSIDTVKILSSHGANFKLRDENGLNCLHAACQSAHLHIVQWLIEKRNANVDDVDYMNNTPLHYAAASGNESILIYLIEKKARITKSSTGNTPLHTAAENNQQAACAILIERGNCSVTTRNSSQLTAADLANNNGYVTLANELRLYGNPPIPKQTNSTNSKKIQLENATVVRLVVKKRNVQRNDASNQVDETELVLNSQTNSSIGSSKKFINSRFDPSELRARVEEHEASRRDTPIINDHDSNVLMHSMYSLNQQNKNRRRSKLPSQRYAPWLENSNLTAEAFRQQIQKTGLNLRKVRRDSLLKEDDMSTNSYNQHSRQSQSLGPPIIPSTLHEEISSSSNSNDNYSNNQENTPWKKTGFQRLSNEIPISKSHQFISSTSQSGFQSDKPDWQRDLVNRRRIVTNGIIPQS